MFRKAALIISGLLLCSLQVYAVAPLITDDTGTQGKDKYQLEVDYAGGVTRQYPGQQITTTLTYGVVGTVDVILSLPYNWHTILWEGSPFNSYDGFNDTTLQVKWRVFESKPAGLSFALKPSITFPSGNEANGFGTGKICEGVMLLATEKWEHGACHCNVGYYHNAFNMEQDNETLQHNLWHASIATEVNMTKNLKSAADIGIDTNAVNAYTANPVYILGGLSYSVTDNLDLDIGVKGRLNNVATPTTFLAGLTSRF
ncbi:MAG: transporter [Chlorobiales bacterium]|nr:transporter [Chlorobiales bacterium]